MDIRERSVETGLYYCNSRYYSPKLYRFFQPADISSLNPTNINGLNLYSYANNNPIGIAYSSSSITGSFAGSMNYSDGLLLPKIPWLIDNSSIIYANGSALFAGIPIVAFYAKYRNTINQEFKLYGISRWKTSLDLSNVKFKMNGLDWGIIGFNVFLDIYDSVQKGISFNGTMAGAGLTLVKDIAMLYLNKGIMWATTSIGTAICPGIGTAIGFGVGLVVSIIVDIFLGNWLDKLIDNITQ